jgi:hypothetical protein
MMGKPYTLADNASNCRIRSLPASSGDVAEAHESAALFVP